MNASRLFSSFKLRDLVFKNRIFVSPMCQYSAIEGVPTDWHLVHLGSRAVGGAALVMVEATGVTPVGRISPGDTGLWNEAQAEAFARIATFIRKQGAVPAIQLAHAGRKASTDLPWKCGRPLDLSEGGWETLAPSAIAFDEGFRIPKEMDVSEIEGLVDHFRSAAKRALASGFQVVELHMAHGYLLNEFLSPLSNHRRDQYGGSLENRMRLPLSVARAVREVWPAKWPLFARISVTDWMEGGWDLEQSIVFSKALKEIGIDLIDCSSGGISPRAKIPVAPGYQVPLAEGVKRGAVIATGAVGLITEATQAEAIVSDDKADVVFLARELLRDPYWPLHAATKLGVKVDWPVQYERARPK